MLVLFYLLSLFHIVHASNASILSPPDGAIIVAGTNFEFEYQTWADYGVSSYNYTVWLFTEQPGSPSPADLFATGYFFGRFSQPNYPGNPYPKNTPPYNLTMPDFSKSLGGFGVGEGYQSKECYFVVLEEYGTGVATAGSRISWTQNNINYNSA